MHPSLLPEYSLGHLLHTLKSLLGECYSYGEKAVCGVVLITVSRVARGEAEGPDLTPEEADQAASPLVAHQPGQVVQRLLLVQMEGGRECPAELELDGVLHWLKSV